MNNDNNGSPTKKGEKKKKKQNFFKSALIKLRSKQKEHDKQKEIKPVKTNDDWKMIVGSMRPLHIPDGSSPPTTIYKKKILRSVRSIENFDNIFLEPPSPTYSTASSGGTMSHYASTTNLHELDKVYDCEADDSFLEKRSADVMIDTKAEEFISQFYQQMRLQLNPVSEE